MEAGVAPTLLIAAGGLQIAVILAVSAWVFRRYRYRERFSVLRVLLGAFLISLCALPFAAILIWQPPRDPETYRAVLLAAAFSPMGVGLLLGYVALYREERKTRANENRGPTTRAALRDRLAAAPSPNRPRAKGVPPNSGEAELLPTEFSFGTREFHQFLIFMTGLCFVGGLLAGVIGGHSWRYTITCALLLPAIFTPLMWLVGCRSTHRSYVISRDGVILRRYDRDLEQLSWEEIADIRPWPLTLITSSGRRIPFQLNRDEMLRARETMLQALNDEGKN